MIQIKIPLYGSPLFDQEGRLVGRVIGVNRVGQQFFRYAVDDSSTAYGKKNWLVEGEDRSFTLDPRLAALWRAQRFPKGKTIFFSNGKPIGKFECLLKDGAVWFLVIDGERYPLDRLDNDRDNEITAEVEEQ